MLSAEQIKDLTDTHSSRGKLAACAKFGTTAVQQAADAKIREWDKQADAERRSNDD